MEYRGIKLHESVKLNNKDGSFNTRVKKGLDKIADRLAKENHLLKSVYKGDRDKVLIDFKCGHDFHWIAAGDYKNGKGCPLCGFRKISEVKKSKGKGEASLLAKLKERGHDLLTPYQSHKEKVSINFKCGHPPHLITPSDYKSGYGCPHCNRKNYCKLVKKREISYAQEFKNLLEANGHVLLSDYKHSAKKVLIDFKCSHGPRWTTPDIYKMGCRCSKCGNERVAEIQLNREKKQFPLIVNANGHVLLSDYGKNQKDKVLIDFKCGHEPHWIEPSNYKTRKDCPICRTEKGRERVKKRSEKNLIRFIESHGHILLSKFITIKDKVLIDFKCGHEPHWVDPLAYMSLGTRCPRCSKNSPKQAEEDLLKVVKNNGHVLLSEYKTAKDKVLINFNCGHKPHWVEASAYKFQSTGCPFCSLSKGEKIIRKWLEDNHIAYEVQYKIGNKTWRYDIYIPSTNTIVEVHGSQHYQFEKHFHKSLKVFYQKQKRDKDKQRYAESFGHNYLIVDYREHKPELALERFLKQFNLLQPTKQKYEQLSLF